ncbi:MAG: histidine kinase [Bacteroidales bacterium]
MKKFFIYFLFSLAITQFVMVYTDVNIFHSLRSWIIGTLYGLFTGMLMIIGHPYITKNINKRVSLLQSPIKSLILHFGIGTIYTILVLCFVNYITWVLIFNVSIQHFIETNWYSIRFGIIVYLIVSFVIYFIIFYKKWKDAAMEQEKQKTESLRLRFEALRTYVNPHFLFNSLSTLTHLIDIDKEKAKLFTHLLSHTYRYIIDNKDKDLVPLDEEIHFTNSYLQLQKIRYGDLITVYNSIPLYSNFEVIPVSVQMLIENVFKHNEISQNSKITIELWIENEYLYVKNNLSPKNNTEDRSPAGGLANIMQRYRYLTNRPCSAQIEDNFFVVMLPLVSTSNKNNI